MKLEPIRRREASGEFDLGPEYRRFVNAAVEHLRFGIAGHIQ